MSADAAEVTFLLALMVVAVAVWLGPFAAVAAVGAVAIYEYLR